MDSLVLGEYSIHTAREGFSNIIHRASGEIMHARMHPMQEARTLYVEQSVLGNLLLAHDESSANEPVTLWDVGLGAAANAVAAIECHEKLSKATTARVRPLHILSFENNLDPLRLAATHRDRFDYLLHPGVDSLLLTGSWRSPSELRVTWQLIEGSFPNSITNALPAPDVIYYDLFSQKTHSEAWEFETFRRLYSACADHASELFTYTVSTASRAGMLAAGFHVARGSGTGPKSETTIALTGSAIGCKRRKTQRDLLGTDWLAKWERSTAKFPPDVNGDAQNAFARTLKAHPQFATPAAGMTLG
jgi:queuine tRNA-ribosyltransferase